MKLIKTLDGSYTFFNPEFSESYHSKSGALDEAFRKYAKPGVEELTKLHDFQNIKVIDVLDPFFGLGYNSLAVIYYLKEILNFKGKIKIVLVELDTKILSKIKDIVFDEININGMSIDVNKLKEYYSFIKYLIENFLISKKNEFKKNNIELKIFNKDIKDILITLNNDFFDIVLYDAFSPKKQPILWNLDVFKRIYLVMKRNSVLLTYSCARVVRDNLKKTNFIVKDGPIVGRRSPATIALKK